MKEFKNFDEAKKNAEYTGTEQIPVGAYVAKIMGVRYENGQNGNSDRIVIQFDIAEGEQKDFLRSSMSRTQLMIRSGRVKQQFMFQRMTEHRRTSGQLTHSQDGLMQLKSQ